MSDGKNGYLALARRVGQSVVLHTTDGPIEVRVTRVESGNIYLGINAPRKVQIVREELERKSRR